MTSFQKSSMIWPSSVDIQNSVFSLFYDRWSRISIESSCFEPDSTEYWSIPLAHTSCISYRSNNYNRLCTSSHAISRSPRPGHHLIIPSCCPKFPWANCTHHGHQYQRSHYTPQWSHISHDNIGQMCIISMRSPGLALISLFLCRLVMMARVKGSSGSSVPFYSCSIFEGKEYIEGWPYCTAFFGVRWWVWSEISGNGANWLQGEAKKLWTNSTDEGAWAS